MEKTKKEIIVQRTIALVLLVLIVGFPYLYNDLTVKASGENWLEGWTYRKSHYINGSSVGAQTDYQINLTVYYTSGSDSANKVYLDGECQTDFDDIRFTISDGSTQLSYVRYYYTASTSGLFYIEISSIPASPDHATIYIYYDNPSVSTTSSMTDTVVWWNDCNSTTGWTRTSGSGAWGSTSGYIWDSAVSADQCFENGDLPNSLSNLRIMCKMYYVSYVTTRGVVNIGAGVGSGWGGKKIGGGINSYTSKNAVFEDDDENRAGTTTGLYVDFTWFYFMYTTYSTKVRYYVNNVYRDTITLTDLETTETHALLKSYREAWRWDDFIFMKFVYPEPSHWSWGSEETEPLEEEPRFLGLFATNSTLYPDVHYYINVTANEGMDWNNIENISLYLYQSDVVLTWYSSPERFLRYYDPYYHIYLNASESISEPINSTSISLSFSVYLRNSYPTGYTDLDESFTEMFTSDGNRTSGSESDFFNFQLTRQSVGGGGTIQPIAFLFFLSLPIVLLVFGIKIPLLCFFALFIGFIFNTYLIANDIVLVLNDSIGTNGIWQSYTIPIPAQPYLSLLAMVVYVSGSIIVFIMRGEE